MRKLSLLLTVAALALAADPNIASATTFSGSCDMTGRIYPVKPYTFVPETNDAEAFATGTCAGTVDGAAYDGPAHLYVDGRMNSPMSCGLLVATRVPAVLTFGPDPAAVDATQIDLIVAEAVEVAAQLPAHVTGAYTGHAYLFAQLSSDEASVRACAGDGLTSTGFALSLDTITRLYG